MVNCKDIKRGYISDDARGDVCLGCVELNTIRTIASLMEQR